MGKLKWNVEKINIECNKLGIKFVNAEYIPKEKQTFICKCGNTFNRMFSNVLLGQIYCDDCRSKIDKEKKLSDLKKNFYEFKEYVESGNSGCKIIDAYTSYKSNKSKIKMKCKCGNTFYPTANNFKRGHERCKSCKDKENGFNKRIEKTFIKEYIRDVGYNYISYKFEDGRHKIIISCENDNHNSYEVDFMNFYHNKTRCPHCNISKGESKVAGILNKYNIHFEKEHSIDNLNGVNGGKLRFDFCIIKNDKKILIEYDGEQHFKPKFGEYEFNRTVQNDAIKNEYCSKNGIRLLRIPYNDFDNIEKIIIEFLNIGNTEITNENKKSLAS